MSSNRNKMNFRQASLTYDPTTKINSRRNSLIKQNSEDLSTHKNNFLNSDIKITVNAKCKTKPNDFPPPKIAWDDDQEEKEVIQQPIIARKCPETRKNTRSLKRQNSLNQDSILSCKEDIISKLRLLLKDEPEVPEKPNLSIFLNQNSRHEENKRQYFEDPHSRPMDKEEKLGVDGPTVKYNSETTTTSLFQFRKNPVKRMEEKKYSTDYQDNKKDPPNILVSPVPDVIMEKEANNESETTITDNSQPINNIIIRPTTAKSRRELFSKRTNSAFHSVLAKEGSTQRPPLQRSSSAPIRPEHAKSKFLATKRKLKSGKKKDVKTAKRWGEDQTDFNSMECTDLNTTILKNGTEIVTMVSLVSPASSDVEEIPDIEEEAKVKSRSSSPKKAPTLVKKEDSVPKISSLRKVVKQVSFQQSSIHSIRSFSAGFPGRKNSMATSMMLGGGLKRANTVQKKQDKRFTNVAASDDEERVPKRRLLRSRSAHVDIDSLEDAEEEDKSALAISDDPPESLADIEVKIPEDIKELKIEETTTNIELKTLVTSQEHKSDDKNHTNTESQDGQLFFTSKEKECWKLFQKMSDKGVKVNYDTLLRGMLTPTEYRTRRQSLAASASIVEEPKESVENEEEAT